MSFCELNFHSCIVCHSSNLSAPVQFVNVLLENKKCLFTMTCTKVPFFFFLSSGVVSLRADTIVAEVLSDDVSTSSDASFGVDESVEIDQQHLDHLRSEAKGALLKAQQDKGKTSEKDREKPTRSKVLQFLLRWQPPDDKNDVTEAYQCYIN